MTIKEKIFMADLSATSVQIIFFFLSTVNFRKHSKYKESKNYIKIFSIFLGPFFSLLKSRPGKNECENRSINICNYIINTFTLYWYFPFFIWDCYHEVFFFFMILRGLIGLTMTKEGSVWGESEVKFVIF